MTTCNCSCAKEAWQAGYEAGATSLPSASPELAQRVAKILAPWLQLEPGRQQLVTIAQAAEQLSMSKSKVYELMRSGELTSVEIPGKSQKTYGRRIEQAEIGAFIERHRVTGGVF